MIYDYKITTGTGDELNLADYKGKVIPVVNTATGERVIIVTSQAKTA